MAILYSEHLLHRFDCAENREKFSALLNQLNIDQPAWQTVTI